MIYQVKVTRSSGMPYDGAYEPVVVGVVPGANAAKALASSDLPHGGISKHSRCREDVSRACDELWRM